MAKKVVAVIKLAIEAGKANPAPPVGTALGPHGVNIMQFCKDYNARTSPQAGMVIPVVITVFADRSFTFETKTPPTSKLLKRAAKMDMKKKPGSGAKQPNKEKVGTVTMKQVEEIAAIKIKDLVGVELAAVMRMVHGTAKSMGIDVAG